MYEMIKDKVKKVKSKIRYFFHPKTIRRMIGKLHPKTIWNGMRSLHYYHWILIAVVAVSLILTLTHYRIAIVRALSTVIDLFDSLKIYFEVIASPTADLPDGVVARIAQLPQIDLQKILPFDIAELQRRLKDMWPCLFKKEYLIAYLSLVVDYSYYVMLYGTVVVELFIAVWILWQRFLFTEKIGHGQDTTYLKRWKAGPDRVYRRVKSWVFDFWKFFFILLNLFE